MYNEFRILLREIDTLLRHDEKRPSAFVQNDASVDIHSELKRSHLVVF